MPDKLNSINAPVVCESDGILYKEYKSPVITRNSGTAGNVILYEWVPEEKFKFVVQRLYILDVSDILFSISSIASYLKYNIYI